MSYPHRLLEDVTAERLLLMPSPFAAVVQLAGTAMLVGPHRGIHALEDVSAAMVCAPNVIKGFAGRPSLLIDAVVTADDVPLLRVFGEHKPSDWPMLLDDLRAAVDMTHDERQFAAVWAALLRGSRTADPVEQRQQERLCRRYAGQAPSAIRRALRLSRQLAADIAAGRHDALGEFADQSHYGRECQALTGCTPGQWRTTRGLWCLPEGTLLAGGGDRRQAPGRVDRTGA